MPVTSTASREDDPRKHGRPCIEFLVTHIATPSDFFGICCEIQLVVSDDPRHKAPALVDLLGSENPQVRYLASRFLSNSYRPESRECFAGEDGTSQKP